MYKYYPRDRYITRDQRSQVSPPPACILDGMKVLKQLVLDPLKTNYNPAFRQK